MDKVKITKSVLKEIESGDTKIKIGPKIIRDNSGIDFRDTKAIVSFIKDTKDTNVLIKRGHNYILVPKRQFDNMNKTHPNKAIPENRRYEKKEDKTIWDIGEELAYLFPDIVPDYKKAKAAISEAGCTGCAARSHANSLLTKIAKLHKAKPSVEIPKEVLKALGPSFGRAIAREEYADKPYGSIAIPVTESRAHKLLEPVRHLHATEGVRPSCLDCCRKHLGQAIVLLQESEYEGYENHFWLGLAHLSEAESESLSTYPGFAKQLRDIRLSMMAARDYVPDLMSLFDDLDMLEFGEKEDSKKTK